MYAWRLRPASICLGGGLIPVPVPAVGIVVFLLVGFLFLEGAQVVQGDGLGVLDLRVDLVDHLVVAAADRQGKHDGGCVWMSEKGTALTNRSHTAVMNKDTL